MKKHWKWFAMGAVVLAAVCAVLYFLGFRITYDPTIITDWDAVSGCAAWAGVFISSVLSAIAIWFAIQVPKKIADRQDKIALFEKRHNVYQILSNYWIFSKMLDTEQSYEQVLTNAQTAFQIPFSEFKQVQEIDNLRTNMCTMLPFLFPEVDFEAYKKVNITTSKYLIKGVFAKLDELDTRKEFIRETTQFWGENNAIFQRYLRIDLV